MKFRSKSIVAAGLLATFTSMSAQAALIARGNDLYYDTELDITWLAKANLSFSESFGVSGIQADGGMDWDTTQAWITAMNTANYLGFNSWRLPTLTPLNGISFNYEFDNLGASDKGYNISAPGTAYAGSTANEMAHLFYNTLSNKAVCDPVLSTSTTCTLQPGFGLVNTGPFMQLQDDRYWTDVENEQNTERAFDFNFVDGSVGTGHKGGYFHAFAVLDGDVGASAVPVPAAVWLFGSGLVGLVTVSRRRIG